MFARLVLLLKHYLFEVFFLELRRTSVIYSCPLLILTNIGYKNENVTTLNAPLVNYSQDDTAQTTMTMDWLLNMLENIVLS